VLGWCGAAMMPKGRLGMVALSWSMHVDASLGVFVGVGGPKKICISYDEVNLDNTNDVLG